MTAQIHERLVYAGEKTSMSTTPPIPAEHPRIRTLDEEEAREQTTNIIVFSTACWRRYIGSWHIEHDRLYLTAVEGIYQLIGEDPLLAEWFTGALIIPRGDVIEYVHMGFATIFEKEIHLRVEKGIVTGWRVETYKEGDTLRRHPRWAQLPGIDDPV